MPTGPPSARIAGPSAQSADDRLESWLRALVDTPGLTAIRDLSEARAVHIDDALVASGWLETGSVVDVGSGGGSPGIPLASARPDLSVTLVEATGKKVAFLRRWEDVFDNLAVEHCRAEEFANGAGRGAFDAAVARALAPPAVALEWALPLVKRGGRFVLYTTSSQREAVAAVAPLLGGRLLATEPVAESDRILCIVEKSDQTPPVSRVGPEWRESVRSGPDRPSGRCKNRPGS